MTFACTCSYIFLIFTSLLYPLGLSPTSHWYPTSSRVPLLFSGHSDPYSVCTSLLFYHQCARLLPHILPCSCCSFPWWHSFCLRQEVMMYFQFAFPLELRILNCFSNIYQAFLFLSLKTLFNSVSPYWLGDLCFAIKLFEFFIYTGC